MRLYLNGNEVGSLSKSGSIATNPNVGAWIGGNPPSATSRPFDGLIDQVRIYDQALTPEQIANL